MNRVHDGVSHGDSHHVTASSPRPTPSWLVPVVIACGLLLVIGASLGARASVATLQPAGTPSASPGAGGTPIASPVASPGASPVAGTIAGSGQEPAGSGQQANEAINAITQRIVNDNPILARAQDPTLGEPVFDPYRILTPDQTNALAGDAGRLRAAGLPTLVYIRISLNNQAQSQQFAQSLVAKPGMVETSDGAQDGMVVLISVPPGAPQKGNIAIAWGAHALPVNGLDAATVQQVEEQDMVPRLKQGQVFPAAQFGLRRFNYTIAYSPYAFPTRSAVARVIGRWLAIVAPVLAASVIALLVLTWFPIGAAWRTGRRWGRRWMQWWPAVLAAILSALMIPLSIYGRTRAGIFAAAAILVAILLDVWVTADRRAGRTTRRAVTVPDTLPARIATRRRAGRLRRPLDDGRGILE